MISLFIHSFNEYLLGISMRQVLFQEQVGNKLDNSPGGFPFNRGSQTINKSANS
jgi:hypothetical protein